MVQEVVAGLSPLEPVCGIYGGQNVGSGVSRVEGSTLKGTSLVNLLAPELCF